MANPPGVNVTVNAPSASVQTNSTTGTWFVTGLTAGGPVGVAVPVNSIQDFNNYFGTISNGALTGRTATSATLYDSLDIYFRSGGIRAYVSRVGAAGGSPVAASCTIGTNFLKLTAVGTGTWANSTSGGSIGLIVTLTTGGTSGFALSVAYNGVTLATSPLLFSNTDAVAWVNSLAVPGIMATAATDGTGLGSIPSAGAFYFTSGANGTTSETDWTAALTPFNVELGAGQVSAPGHTTAIGWQAQANHAYNFNRVAVLDATDTSVVGTLTAGAASIQYGGAQASTDSSYAAMFAPWVKVPGIVSTQPNTIAPTFTRTVPPSSFVAANISATDLTNDANVPAAGVQNGSCEYALDVTQSYVASDRVTLNNAGVNILRNINGVVSVYGFRSLALDANWVAFNNVRFRMQIVRDLDVIAEPFVFAEIDGKGQIFARLAGALSGQCQNYWLRNSIYGINPEDAFNVNVGPQINTPTTIAAGLINAQVNLRMAPQAEQVSVTVTKYLVSATLPSN
jgi:hypothetical protein